MAKESVEPVCRLTMIEAEYRQVVPDEGPPFYGYRIAVTLDGKTKVQFDIQQETANEFAKELNSLAALIPAHTRHRKSN
jgi:hypothetical protein